MCGRIRAVVGVDNHKCDRRLNQTVISVEKATLNRSDDKDRIIDAEGFRPNVGIVIVNAERQVFWGRRVTARTHGSSPKEAFPW